MSIRTTLRSALPAPRSAAAALRRPTALVLQAVLLLAVLAATVAWTVTAKTVQLSLDGVSSEVDFRGDTVADVLEAADLSVGEHDSVVPSPDTEVEDGDRVALRRGRQLTLTVDGAEQTVWTTALSVDEALRQLDLRQEGLALSASRSRRLPLDGFRLDVRTPKAITVNVDGQSLPVTSAAATVGEALAENGITLGELDRVTPAGTDPLAPGLAVTVQRVRSERTTVEETLDAPTEKREDAGMAKGTSKVLQAGSDGLARRTYDVVSVDGAVESRTMVAEERVREPVARIVVVGTKAAPAAPSGPRRSTGDADSLNWGALAQCESGGNPKIVSSNGMYYGLYQFSLSTWRSVGGSGKPTDYDSGEQTYRAKLLYMRSGAGQWPTCGKRLFN